jgi:hypothetical protein
MKVHNTGKVQIGLAYQDPRMPYHDRDALRLQDALLRNAQRTDWDGIAIILCVCVIAGALTWGVV